jgi:hypothetical protein
LDVRGSLPLSRDTKKPKVVEMLGDLAEYYAVSGRYVYLKIRGSRYDYMIYGRGSAGLYNVSSVLAVYTVCDEDSMDERYDPVFRRLKSMECIWDSRKRLFKPNPILEELKAYIPDLQISMELTDQLNRDESIMNSMLKLKPSSLSISLFSIPPEYQPFTMYREALIKGMAEYYKLPLAIRWHISMVKTHPPLSKPPIRSIVDLLESILTYVKSEVDRSLRMYDVSIG